MNLFNSSVCCTIYPMLACFLIQKKNLLFSGQIINNEMILNLNQRYFALQF